MIRQYRIFGISLVLLMLCSLQADLRNSVASDDMPWAEAMTGLASLDAADREAAKVAILHLSQGEEAQASLAKLETFAQEKQPGYLQVPELYARLRTPAAINSLRAIIKKREKPSDFELCRRAILAVGDFWLLDLLLNIETIPEALDWELYKASIKSQSRFAHVPKVLAFRKDWEEAQTIENKNYLSHMWEAKLIVKAEKKTPNLFQLQFASIVVNPYKIDSMLISAGMFKSFLYKQKPKRGSVRTIPAFVAVKSARPSYSRDKFTDQDLQRRFYAGTLKKRRKKTPASWIWVRFRKASKKDKAVEVWMDPAMLAAKFPFQMTTFPEDDLEPPELLEGVANANADGHSGSKASYVPLPATGKSLEDKLSDIEWERLDILIVPGVFDHVELVLDTLKVPYAVLKGGAYRDLLHGQPGKAFVKEKEMIIEELNPKRHILILNCTYGGLTEIESQTMRHFVGAGGYVLATDWAQEQLIGAFPDFIKKTDEEISDMHPCEIHPDNKRHELMTDFKNVDDEFDWWFDGGSWGVETLQPRVKVLARCPEVNNMSVVVTWQYGDLSGKGAQPGRVLYFVSHLEQQQKEEKGDYNLQMCFVNFFRYKEYESKLGLK